MNKKNNLDVRLENNKTNRFLIKPGWDFKIIKMKLFNKKNW